MPTTNNLCKIALIKLVYRLKFLYKLLKQITAYKQMVQRREPLVEFAPSRQIFPEQNVVSCPNTVMFQSE